MATTKLNVEGMSCQHCVNAINTAVGALEGVLNVDVSLENKTVTVSHGDNLSADSIKSAIEDQGYDVV